MLKKLVWVFLAFLFVLVAGFSWAVARLDLAAYQTELSAKIRAKTGRDIIFSGPVRLAFWPDLVVRAERVQITNPPWASRPHMADIGGIDFRLALLPLLRGQYVVRAIDVRDADIVWERAGDGQHNLLFSAEAEKSQAHPASVIVPRQPSRRFDLSLEKLYFHNLQLGYVDAGAAARHLNVSELVFSAPKNQPTNLTAHLWYQQQPFDLSMTLPQLSSLMSGGVAVPVMMRLSQQSHHISFNGEFMPSGPDITGKIEADINQSRILGDIRLDGRGQKPNVTAKIIVDPLMIGGADTQPPAIESAAPVVATDAAGRATGARYQKTDEILKNFEKFNLVLDLDVRRIETKNGVLGSFVTKMTVANGGFMLEPLKAQIGGGTIEGRFDMRPDTGDLALVMTNLAIRRINYGDVLAQAGGVGVMSGVLDGDVNLRAVGRDADSLQRNLQGRVMLDLGPGKIDTRYVRDGWFDRVRRGLPVPIDADMITIHCGYGAMDFTPGLVRMDGFLFDSDLATIFAKAKAVTAQAPAGAVGLAPLDGVVRVRPAQLLKDHLGEKLASITAPIQIRGTLAAPHMRVDGQGVLKDIVRHFLGKDTEQAPQETVPIVSLTTSEGNPCRLALEGGVAPQPVIPVEREALGQKLIAPIQGLIKSIGKE